MILRLMILVLIAPAVVLKQRAAVALIHQILTLLLLTELTLVLMVLKILTGVLMIQEVLAA